MALNLSKSEAIQFSIAQGLHTNKVIAVNVADATIAPTPTIKSLGVVLDAHLKFDDHVVAVCKACYFHIRALRHIRASLPDDVACLIACSIVGSRLDYCNFILGGTSETNFVKL